MSRNGEGNWLSIGMLLSIILLVVKALGLVTWSWWWVPVPFFAELAVGLAFVVLYATFYGRNQ